MDTDFSDNLGKVARIEWEIERVHGGNVILYTSTLDLDENRFLNGTRDGIRILGDMISLKASNVRKAYIDGEKMTSRVELTFSMDLVWEDVVDMLKEGGLT